MHWKCTVALVCIFGVLKKFRPGTPFLAPFLESPEFKNFTNQQVYGEIYTYWTYSNLISMLPIFLCIDFLRYKPILVLEAISLLTTWLLLVYGTSILHMQLVQIFFGIATSADVAYYSYLYAVVKKKHYKRITSYIRTASMVGKFLAYTLGQFLISTELGDYLLLNQITMATAFILVPISLILPMAKKKDQQEPKSDVQPANDAEKPLEKEQKLTEQSKLLEASSRIDAECEKMEVNFWSKYFTGFIEFIEKNFLCHYKNPIVFKWSLWSILTQCGIFQIMSYIQTLWASRRVEKELVWNGFVESANTLLAAFGVFLLQYIPLRWENYELSVFTGSSLAISALLYAMIHFGNIFVDYALYSVLYAFFNVLMAISSNMIASNMNSHSYGLVFGINTFFTVLAETALTLLLVDSNGLFGLSIEEQFLAYSAFFFSIAVLFILIKIVSFVKNFK